MWFVSDTHFGHANIIKYCNRPFANVREMDEALISNWNAVVGPTDYVYHLGDFGFGFMRTILEALHGKKILIVGSHDRDTIRDCSHMFVEITPQKEINISGNHVTLNHYCMRKWPKSHYNAWHLFGHSHGTLQPIGKSWDVGVDANGYRLLSELDIVKIMEKREDNVDAVIGKERQAKHGLEQSS